MADTENPIIEPSIMSVLEKFPFLSFGTLPGHGTLPDTDYLGIVQNSDSQLISIYIIDLLPDEAQRKLLLEFGEDWWWNSNRRIPISMFIKDERFRQFRACLRHFSRKDFDLKFGHCVSLADSMARRVRRRQVTLLRRTTD